MKPKSYCEIAKDVKLLCVGSDNFKTNYLSVEFYVPINEHFAAYNVLTSLMGHTAKNYKSISSFNAKVESLYGADFDTSISTVGEKVRIRFSLEMPDDRFSLDEIPISQQAVDFLVDILLNPNCENGNFDEENTNREIRFTLENIEAEKNDKRAYALSRLRQLMCANEPYGIDREKLEEDVRNLNSEKLFSAYEALLKDATIIITACGSLSEEMLKEKFTVFAESIENRKALPLETIYIEKADEIRFFTEEMDITQAKLVIGLRSGMCHSDDDYFAFRVMTDIFGGGPYSRLFLNVREKMSLCYYCGARLFRDKGIIFIQSGIEEANYEKALSEITNQLDVMKKGEFTDEDFASSIFSLCDAFRGVGDSPASVCIYYSSQAFDKVLVSGPEFAEKISQVTREQVIKCANRVTVDSVYLLKGEGDKNE